MRFYRGVFIILLFPKLSPPITKKYFKIKLSFVVEDAEKLTHITEAEQFSFKSHASFCRSTATIIKLIRKPVEILDIAREIDLNELPEVMFRTKMMPYNKLLTNFMKLVSSLLYGIYLLGTVLGNIGVRPRTNIPQYGPRVQLVRG